MKKIRIRFFNINLGPYSVQDQDINIKYHPSLIDRVFEAVSALMVIAGCIYFVANSGFENKDTLAGFLINLLVCLLVFTCPYTPVEYIRFSVRISRQNIVKQYVMALRLMRIVNILICLMLVFNALSINYPWANPAIGISVTAMLLSIMVYYIFAIRNK
ncbi:hypothetical protein [Bacteroides sp. ET336]|uniref:hypothetical protein n=1 Tax=Bacteroides sp. ET336 TaxID=2972459 RepID=UPI0021AC61D3|nr:hypothetical protein [Bacteroides sp. ET336]MCR8893168.1 hypothetical protein [Bacteroides sp. ET336]MDN0057665.1 hypothetical protein [Bacteroides caecigallinarum]